MLQNESSEIMFIFEPQCHTLVTFFLNLPNKRNGSLSDS